MKQDVVTSEPDESVQKYFRKQWHKETQTFSATGRVFHFASLHYAIVLQNETTFASLILSA
jgi:hypothetical protein